MRHLIALLLLLTGLFFIHIEITSAQTTCLKYPSGSTAPNGYGASWDVFDGPQRLLVSSNCPNTGNSLMLAIGRGLDSQVVWSTAYTYSGSGWTPRTLSGTANQGWINNQGTVSVTAPSTASVNSPFYFVGYVCTNRSGVWKCGCANSACSTSNWQLQGYTGLPPVSTGPTCGNNQCETGETATSCSMDCGGGGGGGGTGGGGTGGGGTGGSTTLPAEFPAITECGSTVNVTPSTLASNIGNGCKTLIMAPGSYRLNFSGHSGGVLTLRCATKGACDVQEGSHISESNGIIIDGIKMETNCTSGCSTATAGYLTFTNVGNLKVQNSTFSNMLQTGLLIDQADEHKQVNIQLVGNTIHSDLNRRFKMSRNGHSYDMDYGFRIHDADSVYVGYNTFDGGFNHALSLKRLVKYALIEHNTFAMCGRACIHAGQQGNTSSLPNISSGLVEVKNNTFNGANSAWGLVIMNLHKVVATNNTFTGFNNSNNLMTSGTNDDTISSPMFYHVFQNGYNGLSGYINQGIPADRQLVQSGNVFK